jgi:FkbM family methyltransferase
MVAARIVQRPVLAAYRKHGPVVNVERRGVNWQLDLREGIDFSIWLRGYFEPSTVSAYRRLVQPGDVVLDIGANIGAHTLHLAGCAGAAGRVIAFEPSAEAYRRLVNNLALNPTIAGRVTPQQSLLVADGERTLPGEVVSSWPLLPRAQLDPIHPGRPQSTSGASVSTLDDTLQKLHVDFVKMDVDGYESDVLSGASSMLEESRPVILFEVAPSVAATVGRRVEDVLDLLHAYRIVKLDEGRSVTGATIAELDRTLSSINALALPRD